MSRRRKSGYAKYQLKNRARPGDTIYIKRSPWMIVLESKDRGFGDFKKTGRQILEEKLEKKKVFEEENPGIKVYTPYEWKIVKSKRQKNDIQYDWYRLVSRKKTEAQK